MGEPKDYSKQIWTIPNILTLLRILLIPVIAGISYEVLQKAGRSGSRISDIVARPGLWMQALTII